jgi:hypothetical protein
MVGEGPFSFLALAVVDRLPMALISVGAWRTDATWLPAIARRPDHSQQRGRDPSHITFRQQRPSAS